MRGLPAIVIVIDGTHIHTTKPCVGLEWFSYFKAHEYSLHWQEIFLLLLFLFLFCFVLFCFFVGLFIIMFGSTNHTRVLRCSSLYHLYIHEGSF